MTISITSAYEAKVKLWRANAVTPFFFLFLLDAWTSKALVVILRLRSVVTCFIAIFCESLWTVSLFLNFDFTLFCWENPLSHGTEVMGMVMRISANVLKSGYCCLIWSPSRRVHMTNRLSCLFPFRNPLNWKKIAFALWLSMSGSCCVTTGWGGLPAASGGPSVGNVTSNAWQRSGEHGLYFRGLSRAGSLRAVACKLAKAIPFQRLTRTFFYLFGRKQLRIYTSSESISYVIWRVKGYYTLNSTWCGTLTTHIMKM